MKAQSKNYPKHIAIIMDGNGRWAQKQGQVRTEGHKNGAEAVREAIKGCLENEINYLTLYAFSTENWNRPVEEVNFLMNLMIESLSNETEELKKQHISIRAIGELEGLPKETLISLKNSIETTKNESKLILTLALNYGSKNEITKAVKQIAQKAINKEIEIEKIDETTIANHLYTKGLPDPDIMIRTSNEYRLSNFLLWQMAYTEFFFLEKHWPEFVKEDIKECISQYLNRERRFGKTSHQIGNE